MTTSLPPLNHYTIYQIKYQVWVGWYWLIGVRSPRKQATQNKSRENDSRLLPVQLFWFVELRCRQIPGFDSSTRPIRGWPQIAQLRKYPISTHYTRNCIIATIIIEIDTKPRCNQRSGAAGNIANYHLKLPSKPCNIKTHLELFCICLRGRDSPRNGKPIARWGRKVMGLHV